MPREIGLVWNDTATKYENSYTTLYLIEERTKLDGRVIVCREGAGLCTLYGARVEEKVGIDSLHIFKDCLLYTSPSPRD